MEMLPGELQKCIPVDLIMLLKLNYTCRHLCNFISSLYDNFEGLPKPKPVVHVRQNSEMSDTG